jgi:hypothetical protein
MRGALALVFLAALAAAPAAAGDMTPDAGPNAAGSLMPTLQQVWEKVTTGGVVAPDPARPFTGADIQYDGSMHDLKEIFGALPLASDGGAAAGDVCSPFTFWGLKTGAWGGLNASTLFRTGTRDCTSPVFSTSPGNQTASENGSVSFALAVSDPGRVTPDNLLTFLATSSDAALLPAGGIGFAWNATESAWYVTLTPVAHTSGSSTVTIQAVDLQGNRSALQSFVLTVTPVNQQPTISAIGNQATNHNVPTSVIPFFVGDDHTPAASLVVTATSNAPTIVPSDVAHLVLAGTGTDRTIKVIPAADAPTGSATITITAQEPIVPGSESQTRSFTLAVTHVNRPPAATSFSRTVAVSATPYDLVTSANVSDPDAGDTLSLSLVAPLPTRGTAAVASGPKITYLATSNGSDSVVYAVCDAQGLCDHATVSLTVNP